MKSLFLLFLMALSPLSATSPALKSYFEALVASTVERLGGEGLISYEDSSFSLGEQGQIEEVTLCMRVHRPINSLVAQELLHGIHTIFVRNINLHSEGREFFAPFPVSSEQVGVRLYCSAAGADTAGSPTGLQRAMLRALSQSR